MDTVNKIKTVQTGFGGPFPSDVPRTPIIILSAMTHDGVAPLQEKKSTEEKKPISNANSSGTGFFVNAQHIVTNAHVVDGCKQITANKEDALTVKALDIQNDLAILATKKISQATSSLRSGKVNQGEAVTVVGFPLQGLLSAGPQVTYGNISAMSGILNDSRFFQISAPIQPGNSGGPAVDASGNIVGVVTSKLNALKMAKTTGDVPQNINFMINLATLKNFLELNSISFNQKAATKQLTSVGVATQTKSFTVLIDCYQ
jgi:S1-C subfamily serine protease